MDFDDILIYALVGVSAYLIYKNFIQKPTTQAETVYKLDSLPNSNVYSGTYDDGVYLNSGNTTYKFSSGDYDRLNTAQKILLSFPFIPKKWVLQ